MKRSELTGLVLTHGERDPMVTLDQLATVCGQIVVVQDTRTPTNPLPLENISNETEITVVDRDFDTFPAQRNAGIEKARGDWVLSVDSDEYVSRDLAEALTGLRPAQTDEVYGIPRQELLHGQTLSSRLYCDYHPRLFRSHIRYAATPVVHEEFVDFDYGQLGFIEAPLVHDMSDSLYELFTKSYAYGRAWQLSRPDSECGLRQLANITLGPVVRHGGWRDGIAGLAIAATQLAYGVGRYSTRTQN